MIGAIARRIAELVAAVREHLDDNEPVERDTDVDYTMPGRYWVDMDPDPPLADLPDYTPGVILDDDDTPPIPGVYL